MERETLLTSLWKMDGEDDRQNAEILRVRLESGDLAPAGNFRNVSPDYWAAPKEH